jgi:hypothetical protein
MMTMNDLWAAYEEAQSQWTGCDWATRFGCLGLNLDGISSRQARETAAHWGQVAGGGVAYDDLATGEEVSLVEVAQHLRLKGAVAYSGEDQGCRLEVLGESARRFCAEALAREWGFAAGWLEEMESDATWAEEEAGQAVHAAERGDWDGASSHACLACEIESEYRRCRTWRHLRRVITGARESVPSAAVAVFEPWPDKGVGGQPLASLPRSAKLIPRKSLPSSKGKTEGV